MIGKAVSQDNMNVAYVAPTYAQARDIAWLMLINMALPVIIKKNEARLELTVRSQFGGESLISLRGWESVESLRGQRFDFLVVDEIASMRNWWDNWQEIVRPTLTDAKGDALFISTPKGYNHFYELFQTEEKDEDYKSFQYTSYDNPFIAREEIDKAKEEYIQRENADKFDQEYMAEFRAMAGMYFHEWDSQIHVVDAYEIPKTFQRFICMDYGQSQPSAVYWVAVDYDGRLIVYRELWGTGYTFETLIDQVRSLTLNTEKIDYMVIDPALFAKSLGMEKSGAEVFMAKGFNVIKGANDRIAGWTYMRQHLRVYDDIQTRKKTAKILFFRNCVNAIRTIPRLVYDERKVEDLDTNQKDENNKNMDDCADAIRYGIMSRYTMKKPKSEIEIYLERIKREKKYLK
jgi:hypothetical protein